jgi:hypothetical protein
MIKRRIAFIATSAIVLFVVISFLTNKYHNEWVRSHPQMYPYETYFGSVNQALIIEDLSYKEEYVNYYRLLEKRIDTSFSFPLKTLPEDVPVYVVGYTKDGLLADVVSYFDRGPFRGRGYLRGYIYLKTLHQYPPPVKKDTSRAEGVLFMSCPEIGLHI